MCKSEEKQKPYSTKAKQIVVEQKRSVSADMSDLIKHMRFVYTSA